MNYRTERAMRNFNLPLGKVKELWAIFCRHAHSGRGAYLAKAEFYGKVIKLKETCLSDQLFRFIGSETDDFLSFGEFVELVTTFACFEKKELLRYFFSILDPRRTGLIGKNELKHFVYNMWGNQVYSNVTDGLAYLDNIDDGDEAFNFKQVEKMANRYPMTLAPLYKLQVAMIQNTFGERWWEMHKARLSDARLVSEMHEYTRQKLKEKQKMKDKEVITDAMILQRMGK
eukprot:gene24839-28075_t